MFLDFNVSHRVPVGYVGGSIRYKWVNAAKLDINSDVDGVFSLEFLDNLPPNYRVQIGDTFYIKTGSDFVYDYLNVSYDFRYGNADGGDSLEELSYKEIWIWVE